VPDTRIPRFFWLTLWTHKFRHPDTRSLPPASPTARHPTQARDLGRPRTNTLCVNPPGRGAGLTRGRGRHPWRGRADARDERTGYAACAEPMGSAPGAPRGGLYGWRPMHSSWRGAGPYAPEGGCTAPRYQVTIACLIRSCGSCPDGGALLVVTCRIICK